MVDNLTRRSFLQLSVGMVAISVLPVGGWAQTIGTAGHASQRIDGFAKVTGQKVYARDFSAADMGWPGQQWYALFARALTTSQTFDNLDLSSLPAAAKPTKVIYGDELHATARAPRLTGKRDLHLDQKDSFDKLGSFIFDLVVKRGHAPDFLGQAVALMLFDNAASYRTARNAMQFQDAGFQKYGAATPPPPEMVFSPTKWYVRFDQPSKDFSYAQETSSSYTANAPFFAGQIDAYLQNTPNLIKHSFSADMRAMDPMFMEPEAGLVWDDGGHLKLVLGTQSPDGDIKDIAAMYDSPDAPVSLSEITLKSCYPGGGFGGRDSSPFSLMLALCAPFSEGNPVRLEYDRFEQFRVGLKRHACTLSGQIAVTPKQKIMVNQTNFNFDGGGRRNLSPYVAQLAALCSSGAYEIPMADVHTKAVHSENISGGSQRGFGGPQAYFAIETALDDICAAQNWDPFDLRLNNIIVEGGRTISGGKVEQSLRLSEMLDIARAHPVWADRAAIKARYAAKGQVYGTGMAMSLQAYGTSGDGMVASVEMDAEGNITVASDAVDMGNGSATTLATVVGKILGRNASSITMGGYQLFGETGLKDPYKGEWSDPTWTAKGVGSSSACLTGLHQVHVAEQAAKALFMMSILPQAQNAWRLDSLTPAQTAWVDGALTYLPGGKLPLPQADLAKWNFANMGASGALAHGFIQGTWASAEYDIFGLKRMKIDGLSIKSSLGGGWTMIPRQNTIAPTGNPRAGRYAYAPAINLIGLIVDKSSGRVQVENSVTVLNAGRIHVEPLVSGQAQGGLAMAIGWTLLEDMPPGMDGPADGTWNLNKYHVPRSRDLPLNDTYIEGQRSQELILLPADGDAPGRGIAEAVMVSIAPAISNAIKDATGVRFTSLPITPAKILEGLA
ncbi:MAG: xanthine dehydrogenase family protein molybdopterin-binding subunit [Rhodobacteraceae bacterium]|nr:xanthine dehydrogenase family protein molybdopterin-binding subunit [Paracoccaceae bacterium]